MPTYASQANTGYLGTFATGDSASPPAFTPTTEIGSIGFDRYSIPSVTVTHLLSPATTEELIPGLMAPGTINLSGNFIGDPAQVATLDTFAQAQTIFPYRITVPVQRRSKVATITGNCFIVKHSIGPIEPNKKVDFSANFQTTGFSSITVA